MSIRRTLATLLALAVSATCTRCGGDDGARGAASSTGWSGRFRAQTANGPAVLTVAEIGEGRVRVTIGGESSTGRITDAGRVEGEETSEQGGGKFVLELRGDRLTMKAFAVAPDGSVTDVPETVFERLGPEAAGGSRDTALVGHWRHTDARASASFSEATDEHLLLSEDGSYTNWTKTVGSMGERESARRTGAWKTSERTLFLRPDAESDWQAKGGYSVSESNLLFTYGGGGKQIFERQ